MATTEWKQYKWGNLATLEYGKGIRGYLVEPGIDTPYQVYGTNGPIGWWDVPLCRKPGIIIGRKGAYRGVHYSPRPFFVIDTAFYLNLLSREVDTLWAYYQLVNVDINTIDSGSAIPSTSREAFYQIPVNLPPLPTQQKIAGILSAYDDLIENNARRIALLEEMARALYREWFVEFRYPGHEGVPLVESQLGPIPQGWRVMKLGEIAQEVRRGIDPDEVAPETPYIGLEHLPRRSIAISEWGQAQEVQSTKLVFHKGDILFGKIRPYFHKVAVAPVDGVCSTDAIVITPKSPDLFALTLACVSSDDFVQHAIQTSQGTKMPRANWDILTQYLIALPTSQVLEKFSQIVEDIVAAIEDIVITNRNLRCTRDLLLPKLVSGEVDAEGMEVSE